MHLELSIFQKKKILQQEVADIVRPLVLVFIIKHITMGEGGCITTNNEKIFNYAKDMRNHFMIKEKEK